MIREHSIRLCVEPRALIVLLLLMNLNLRCSMKINIYLKVCSSDAMHKHDKRTPFHLTIFKPFQFQVHYLNAQSSKNLAPSATAATKTERDSEWGPKKHQQMDQKLSKKFQCCAMLGKLSFIWLNSFQLWSYISNRHCLQK